MNRTYKCPICGSQYSSLNEMYSCALRCEKEENNKEAERKALEKQKNAELEKIRENYENLVNKVTEYNKKYNAHIRFSCCINGAPFTIKTAKPEEEENLRELLTTLFK